MSARLHVRPADGSDLAFLWRMLAFAASMSGTDEDVQAAQHDPLLRAYVDGFGRDGDVGVVALVGDERVGADWLRLAPPGPVSSSKVWTSSVPELAIATVPTQRARGVGTLLVAALLEAVEGRYASIALSVREGSPAIRLYERAGFVVARRIVNRVGSASLVMIRESTPR